MSPKTRGLVFTLAATGVFFAACKEEKRVTQYTVSKEPAGAASNDFTTGNTATTATPAVAPAAAPAGMNATPGLIAQTSGIVAPEWTAPTAWVSQPESPMRKGSWKTGADKTAAEVSVTAFPGDVGGLQANVNRWCGQVGLPAPATPEELAKLCVAATVAGLPATRVELVNGDKALTTVLVQHDGATWFFKLSGATTSVAAANADFASFLASVKFPAGK